MEIAGHTTEPICLPAHPDSIFVAASASEPTHHGSLARSPLLPSRRSQRTHVEAKLAVAPLGHFF